MAKRAEPAAPALPRRLPKGGPKGQALRGILEELLAALPPGAALPSERELADRYGLARMTVRSEIERLTAEGLVYRLQGRGTFVSEPRVAQAGALSSFTEDMVSRGLTPGSAVRSTPWWILVFGRHARQRAVAAAIDSDEAALLDVPEGAPGLRFHTVAWDGDGVPAYYAASLYRGDRYEIEMRQTRPEGDE